MKEENKNGLGITGFVLSLIGLIGWIVPYFSIWFSIAAIVFSTIQKKRYDTGLATAGLVIGILGTIGNLMWTIFVFTLWGMGYV